MNARAALSMGLRQKMRSFSQTVFDSGLKRKQRQYAASRVDAAEFDYLRKEVSKRLVDRIEDIQRDFPYMLDIGCHRGHVYEALNAQEGLGGVGAIGGVRKMCQGDTSEACVAAAAKLAAEHPYQSRCPAATVFLDPEEELPFEDGTFDLVTSSLALHWCNDLPKVLREIHRVLKPDGCFIGAMLGGTTLHELREAMLIGESEREGGMSPHTSPMAGASEVGGLLSSARFALPTVDVDTIVCEYSDAFMLMDELQGMGESNASLGRRTWPSEPPVAAGQPPRAVTRETFLAAAATYHYTAAVHEERRRRGGLNAAAGEAEDSSSAGDSSSEAVGAEVLPALSELTIPATFQVIFMIGWTPHSSQQQPEKRGTATRSLSEISVTKTAGRTGSQ